MVQDYAGVTTRFLRQDERLLLSDEQEMPLVIEASHTTDIHFLQTFLAAHSTQITHDIAKYGAVLLRGFKIRSDEDFENTVLSINGFRGISDAFMSEYGRVPVGQLKYVLHTNAVFKTGGTLYLGGFHSENYYVPDVPSYICFCCHKPSNQGGETGLVNMEKVYQHLDQSLKEKLNQTTFFTAKWLVTDVAKRYQISAQQVEAICKQFDLPIIGEANQKLILMYKPSIFEHAMTKQKALQINLFALPTLNSEIRKHFLNDYQGKTWFWHRFVWRLPNIVLRVLEWIYVTFASLFYSPKESFKMLLSKWHTYQKAKHQKLPAYSKQKVGDCFTDHDVKNIAKLIRTYYSSCLWQKGDILLVDNRKVAHAGMPGAGPRLVRAMVCNPIDMKYTFSEIGSMVCQDRQTETIGYYMTNS